MGGSVGKALSNPATLIAAPLTYTLGAAYRTAKGVQTMMNAPRDAAAQMSQLQAQQQAAADAQLRALALQPKTVQSDPFLARQRSAQDTMRLGIAATMATAPGMGGAPTVATPTLKTKLGQ